MDGPWSQFAAPSDASSDASAGSGPWSQFAPAGAASSAADDASTQPSADRTPTIGRVGQQFGYGVLQGIPGAIESTANMLEKGTMQGFTNPDTGESMFSQLGRDLGIGNTSAPSVAAPYQPKSGNLINSGLNAIGLNPNNLPAPQSGLERIANMAGQGAVLAAAPELGAGDAGLIARGASMLRPAAVGAASGAGAQGAAEVVPDQYKPLASIAGGLIAGVPVDALVTGAKAGLGAIGEYATPLGIGKRQVLGTRADGTPITATNAQSAAVGAKLAGAASDSQAAMGALSEPGELVPGSQPTTFQQSGDMGLGSLERSVATQNPEAFLQRRADQNVARVGAFTDVQNEGYPEAAADLFRQNLAGIDDQTQAALDQASQNVNSQMQGVGAARSPEEVGSDIQGAVNPQLQATQQQARNALEGIGGTMAPSAIGDQARLALQTAQDASKSAASDLWHAVDPDNTMQIVTSPLKRAVQSIYSNVGPAGRIGVTPIEGELAGAINSYGGVIPFNELGDLRSQISSAMRAAKSPLQPNDVAYARLTQLRGAVEDAISDSIQGKAADEQQAVQSGSMSPDDTMMARLQQQAQEWKAGQVAARASGQSGLGDIPAAGTSPISGVSGTASEAGGGLGNTSGNQGLSPTSGARPAVRDNVVHQNAENLAAALRNRGMAVGAIDHSINRYGQASSYFDSPLGRVRVSDHSNNPNFDTANVHVFGGRAGFNAENEADRLAGVRRQHVSERNVEREAYDAKLKSFADRYAAATSQADKDAILKDYIASGNEKGPRRWEEVDRQTRQSIRKTLENGAPNSPSVVPPPTSGLIDQATADRLATATAATKEMKQTFGAKPVANILQRPGASYDYTMPSPEVARQLWSAGPKGQTAIQGVLRASKNAPEAVEAIREAAAADLRSKAPDGILTPETFGRWRAAHQAGLSALEQASPGTIQRFENAAQASRGLERFGSYSPTVPASSLPERYFAKGDKGFDAVNDLRSVIGKDRADPLLRSYAADSLRKSATDADGTLNQAKIDTWRKQHAGALKAMPELSASLADTSSAATHLENVARVRREALKAYQETAAGKIMGLDDPADITKTIGGMLGRNDSVKQMRDLASEVGENAPARDGVRKAIVDYMKGRLISNTEAGTSGQDLIKADQFQTFLSKNRAALRPFFSDEELETWQKVAQDLKRANRSVTAVKLPGQSNTAQDLAAVGKHSAAPSILHLAAHAFGKIALPGLGYLAEGPTGFMTGLAANHVMGLVDGLRSKGIAKMDDLLTEAMLHPEVARKLMAKAPKKVPGNWGARVARSIVVPSANAALAQGQ